MTNTSIEEAIKNREKVLVEIKETEIYNNFVLNLNDIGNVGFQEIDVTGLKTHSIKVAIFNVLAALYNLYLKEVNLQKDIFVNVISKSNETELIQIKEDIKKLDDALYRFKFAIESILYWSNSRRSRELTIKISVNKISFRYKYIFVHGHHYPKSDKVDRTFLFNDDLALKTLNKFNYTK